MARRRCARAAARRARHGRRRAGGHRRDVRAARDDAARAAPAHAAECLRDKDRAAGRVRALRRRADRSHRADRPVGRGARRCGTAIGARRRLCEQHLRRPRSRHGAPALRRARGCPRAPRAHRAAHAVRKVTMLPPPLVRGALLWLAGIDLRLTLLAVPPVIPLIHRDLHLNEAGVAALSNLPVLTLAVSSALRGAAPSLPMLFAMTVVMGAGIAMIQPAFPSLARAWFAQRIALGTGIWANGLLCGEAISASLTIPFVLPLVGGSWERSFVAWSIPVAVTALALALVRDADAETGDRGTAWLPNFRDPRVWQLGTYQAAASLAYFGANTFLPDYLHATGQGGLVGAALAALNIGQIPASIAVGLIPMRVLGRRRTSFAVAALIVASLAGVLWLGGGFAIAGVALLGFSAAYVLTVSFALPAMLAPREEVARLASGTFTLGYSISFITTLLSGAAWDATHVAATAFVPMFAAAVIVIVLGPRLGSAARQYAVA